MKVYIALYDMIRYPIHIIMMREYRITALISGYISNLFMFKVDSDVELDRESKFSGPNIIT